MSTGAPYSLHRTNGSASARGEDRILASTHHALVQTLPCRSHHVACHSLPILRASHLAVLHRRPRRPGPPAAPGEQVRMCARLSQQRLSLLLALHWCRNSNKFLYHVACSLAAALNASLLAVLHAREVKDHLTILAWSLHSGPSSHSP